MTDQPEALRLADEIDTEELSMDRVEKWVEEAAAELRRQHDEIEKLRGEVARLTELHTLYQDKTERLKAERDALKKALEMANAVAAGDGVIVNALKAERDAAVRALRFLLDHGAYLTERVPDDLKAAIDAARGKT